MSLQRIVKPEMLDSLPGDDPRAIRSRSDLRRINRLMGTAEAIGQGLDPMIRGRLRGHIMELGAGDGSLMLRIARQYAKHWPKVRLNLIDLQPVVHSETLTEFRELGWDAQIVGADAFDWLALPEPRDPPIVVANLFVHHFEGARLQKMLDGIAARSRALICCEPRRNSFALGASSMLWAIGCNRVTLNDGKLSVHAGFRDNELSALWPKGDAWDLREERFGLFAHRFVAVKKE